MSERPYKVDDSNKEIEAVVAFKRAVDKVFRRDHGGITTEDWHNIHNKLHDLGAFVERRLPAESEAMPPVQYGAECPECRRWIESASEYYQCQCGMIIRFVNYEFGPPIR